MSAAILRSSPIRAFVSSLAASLLLSTNLAQAQDAPGFDPIAAAEELADLTDQVDADNVELAVLNNARARSGQIAADASACAAQWTEERSRLEARFEPLADIGPDVAPAIFDQRIAIQQLLDEAITQQSACAGVEDDASSLIDRITLKQDQISQRFLSFKNESVIGEIRQFPARIQSWPAEIRDANQLTLVNELTPVHLFWFLIGGGVAAAGLGVLLRQRFHRWFAAGGGPNAEPQMRYLFPKPLAEYSPSLLSGLAFIIVLYLTIDSPSLDLAVIRIALGIFLFGVGCVIIDWATGPLSPSASVKGLVPDHVRPLRRRLRILFLTLVFSFVLLGTDWLAIRLIGPEVTGRAAVIFLVAVALLYLNLYLGKIPGLKNRFRLLRLATTLALLVGIVADLIGYQNFAGYIIHGITRSAIALFVVWILVWLVSVSFDYVIRGETSTAANLRQALGGPTAERSRTGLGLMQLIADLVLWLSLVVYLIYVWDESGTTLDRLIELIARGGSIGNVRLVPAQIIGGILVFAALLIVIGWIKRWIDRRWLQHIVMERGAREALITLFGYVAFVIALLIGLTQAGVDLGGLAIVSGALALGIGFGLQEIANNFVSGLILLFERPIRSGDFVTVGEVEGFVRRISIRATEIETLDNQNVMVPNSELVSGRVTNWVLRDTHGRLRVVIGVAYGSDVETVRTILEDVACAHPEVITDGRAPAPRALFMGFGDSSLDFELRCRINRIDRRFTVISDLNFAIDAAFREAGISIPFPQRDLHIVSYPEQVTEAPATAPEDTMKTRALADVDAVTRRHQQDVEIGAGIDDVWQALTDPGLMGQWLNASVSFSPYIGGAYDVVFEDGSRISGRIDVYVPPRRMRMIDAPREGDEPLPTGPITTLVTLAEHDKKVTFTVTVSGFPATEDWETDYNRSVTLWQNALIELNELLSRK